MTIDKAIRRLRSYLRWRLPVPNDNFCEAVQLGMEALKEIRHLHKSQVLHEDELLPGETKDDGIACPFERIRSYPACFEDCPDTEQCPKHKRAANIGYGSSEALKRV